MIEVSGQVAGIVAAVYGLINIIAAGTETKKDDKIVGITGQVLRVLIPGLRFGRHK